MRNYTREINVAKKIFEVIYICIKRERELTLYCIPFPIRDFNKKGVFPWMQNTYSVLKNKNA